MAWPRVGIYPNLNGEPTEPGGFPHLPNLESPWFLGEPWKKLRKVVNDTDQTKPMKQHEKNSTFWWFRMMFPIKHIISSKLLPPISLVGKPKHGIIRVLFSAGVKVKPGFFHFFHSPFHLWPNYKGRTIRTTHSNPPRRIVHRSRSWKKPRWVFMPPNGWDFKATPSRENCQL